MNNYYQKRFGLILVSNLIVLLTYSQITPTDYSNSFNWIAHPMLGSASMQFDPSYTVINPDTTQKTYVNVPYDTLSNFDIFCVYATTVPGGGCNYSSFPAQNFPISDTCHRLGAQAIIRMECTMLARFGRIYAPYYRQANLGAFALVTPSGLVTQAEILDTAVTDIIAAFEYYMQYNNNGKKVILFGHSQGANVLSMMLRKFEANPTQYPYLNKIFLSVLVGVEAGPFAIQTQDTGGWFKSTPICQAPSDTGCVCTWGLHRNGTNWKSILPTNKVAYNVNLKNKGYLYTTLDSTKHEVLIDPLIYSSSPTPVGSMFPNSSFYFPGSNYYNVNTTYIYYSNKYSVSVSRKSSLDHGILVDTIITANDKRYNPLSKGSGGSDLHVYDTYIMAGDIMNLIYQKINHTTGIIDKDSPKATNINIYPNPAHSVINIIISNPDAKGMRITLYDYTGKSVMIRTTNSSAFELNCEELPVGIYLIRVDGTEGNFYGAGRIVIE